MIHIFSSAFISQPIKRVFEFICTPENDFQWQYETLASTRLSEGVVRVGACFRRDAHLMGHRTQSTFEVIEYEPNQRYAFKTLTGPLLSITSYTFDIARRYTQVIVSTQVNVVNMIEINENVLEKKMKRQMKENLAMLKQLLEVG